MTHLCYVLFLVCLYVCVCECLFHNNMRMYTSNQYPYVRGPLRECRLIQSGASGLRYYCAPLVCISVVIGLLGVWRHNKPKTKPKTPYAKERMPGASLWIPNQKKNVYFKKKKLPSNIQPTFMCPRFIAGVPFAARIRSGASRLPYSCAPLVCVSDVIEFLAV